MWFLILYSFISPVLYWYCSNPTIDINMTTFLILYVFFFTTCLELEVRSSVLFIQSFFNRKRMKRIHWRKYMTEFEGRTRESYKGSKKKKICWCKALYIYFRISTTQSKRHKDDKDESKSYMIRPRMRQVMSASEVNKNSRSLSPQRNIKPESKLASYSPDKFATVDTRLSDSRMFPNTSFSNPLSRNSLMTSYFMPRKMTSPRLRHSQSDPNSKNVFTHSYR